MRQKLIFASLAAAAVMTSCSNDDTLSVNTGEGITFRTPAVQTRATETTTDNLSEFNVTALTSTEDTYFKDVTFSKQQGGSYTSATDYYWPGDGSTLSFYAYAPTSLNPTIDGTTKQLEFTPDDDIGDQVDFIVATATGNKMSNESTGVALTFYHKLSQIEVKALNDNTDAYTFSVKGVKIGSVVNSGTYNFNMTSGSDSWTEGSNKSSYEVEYTSATILTSTAVSIMGDGGNAMLIPQQLTAWVPSTDGENENEGSYISVLLNIKTVAGAVVYPFGGNDTEYAWAAIPVDTEWKMGNKYIYTLVFGHGGGYVDPDEDYNQGDEIFGGPIFFTVEEVKDWTNETEDIDF